jgi:rRNA maturation RNase YbeY
VFADHERVRDLNERFLQHDHDTDVLSFTLEERADRTVDGEIYVDLDTAEEQARELGLPFRSEVVRYVVHGLLHLLGYDDSTREGTRIMREKEEHYLSAVGPAAGIGPGG